MDPENPKTRIRYPREQAVQKLESIGATLIEEFNRVVLNLCDDANDAYRLVFRDDELFVVHAMKRNGTTLCYDRSRANSDMHDILVEYMYKNPYTVYVHSSRYEWNGSQILIHTVKDVGDFVYLLTDTPENEASLRTLFDVTDDIISSEDFHSMLARVIRKNEEV